MQTIEPVTEGFYYLRKKTAVYSSQLLPLNNEGNSLMGETPGLIPKVTGDAFGWAGTPSEAAAAPPRSRRQLGGFCSRVRSLADTCCRPAGVMKPPKRPSIPEPPHTGLLFGRVSAGSGRLFVRKGLRGKENRRKKQNLCGST